MKRNKKIISIIALTLSATIVIGGAFAYFTDTMSSQNQTIQAGAVVLDELNPVLDNNGNSIWNPGDYSTLTFDLTNVGSKSVTAGYRVELKWNPDEDHLLRAGAADFTASDAFRFVQIFEDDGSGSPGTEVIPQYDSVDGVWYLQKYDTVLNGTVETETQAGGASSKEVVYHIYFKDDATNLFQGVELDINVSANAIQFRNTEGITAAELETYSYEKAPADVR